MNRVGEAVFWLLSTLLVFCLIPLLPLVYLVDRFSERQGD
jgi:hypothetical protein